MPPLPGEKHRMSGTASAADLKFLNRLPQARIGTSNRKRHWNHILAGAPLLPKFVLEVAAMYHELRKRGTSGLRGLSGPQGTAEPAWDRDGHAHVWLPYTQMKVASRPLPVVATEGSRIVLADGRVLIDGIASWWTACHGYNHPHIG